MRKISLVLGLFLLSIVACQRIEMSNPSETVMPLNKRACGSNEYLQQQLQADPALASRMANIEQFTRDYVANNPHSRLLASGIIEIPVVVNVVYKTAAQNISQAQIQSQIDALNNYYAALNADYA